MENIKVIIPRNKTVIVRDGVVLFTLLQEGETLVNQGNYINCIVPFYDGKDFVDIETKEAKAIRLASIPKKENLLTYKQIDDVITFLLEGRKEQSV